MIINIEDIISIDTRTNEKIKRLYFERIKPKKKKKNHYQSILAELDNHF